MHILLRVARDALLVSSLFALGGFFGLAFADAAGLTGMVGTTMTSWELFGISLIGYVVFFMLLAALVLIPTQGWRMATTVFVAAIALAYVADIRDALVG